MSDWLIIRIPLNNPNKIEVVDVLPNVPIKWQDYLDKVAEREKKPGRYLVANTLYKEGEAFYPPKKRRKYHQTEKNSGE